MIAHLRGTLYSKTTTEAVVDCHGVGYLIALSGFTSSRLPEVGESVTLLTLHVVREDGQFLFGFWDAAEREIFRLLTSVSGIGPKIALGILSSLPFEELQEAILRSDLITLQKLNGVGRKTAERIIIELRDKIGSVVPPQKNLDEQPIATQASVRSEVVAGLVGLGFARQAAEKAVRSVLVAEPQTIFTSEVLLRKALKSI